MSRRNKKGQRARVICDGANAGIIVLVLRPYFFPEKFDGCTWYGFRFPWVVTSLGRPLQYVYTADMSPAPPTQSGVLDDDQLQPLDDDDDGLSDVDDQELPKTTGKAPAGSCRVDENRFCHG